MAIIPKKTDPTLEAIDRALIERDQLQPRRGYLGASGIGHPCQRKLWLDFRHAAKNEFDAATLKRFEDGHRGEDIQAERLRMVDGIQLITHKADGGQFGFVGVNGHFKGHYDGIIKGILQAPKTWHTWEHKQVIEQSFKKLDKLREEDEKSALRKWNHVYYCQAVIYMHMEGLTRHYMTVATPGGRDTISVRTNENPVFAKELLQKAAMIVERKTPPVKLSNDPSHWECKTTPPYFQKCDHYDQCHQNKIPLANCRTCVYVEIQNDKGEWLCKKHGSVNPALCEDHRYIPELMPFQLVGSESETDSIIYKTNTGKAFKNGPRGVDSYTSMELEAMPEGSIEDEAVNAIRETFGAEVVK